MVPRLLFVAGAATLTFAAGGALAAPRWVDREITLPRHDVAFDVGIGVGRSGSGGASVPRPPPGPNLPTANQLGPGMNLEMTVAVVRHLELGLRTGVRFGNEARAANADYYARTLFTETYGTRSDSVANPEFKLRWAAYSGSVFEIGLDGRVFLPIETGSRIGAMFGVPLAFHIGDVVRLDTGLYIPVVAYDPNPFSAVSVPLNVWIQASNRVWVGPMSSLRFVDPGPGGRNTELVLGVGGGYQALSWLDLKAMFLFPRINETEGARDFGFGFGAQFRIE